MRFWIILIMDVDYFVWKLTDSQFLLRFLRCKKFNVPMAQEATERYLLLRQVYHPAFHCLNIEEPTMNELLNLGYLFAVPGRDSKGRRVIVARPGKNFQLNSKYPKSFLLFLKILLTVCLPDFIYWLFFSIQVSLIRISTRTRTCVRSTQSRTRHWWKTRKVKFAVSCTLLTVPVSAFLILRSLHHAKLSALWKTARY